MNNTLDKLKELILVNEYYDYHDKSQNQMYINGRCDAYELVIKLIDLLK